MSESHAGRGAPDAETSTSAGNSYQAALPQRMTASAAAYPEQHDLARAGRVHHNLWSIQASTSLTDVDKALGMRNLDSADVLDSVTLEVLLENVSPQDIDLSDELPLSRPARSADAVADLPAVRVETAAINEIDDEEQAQADALGALGADVQVVDADGQLIAPMATESEDLAQAEALRVLDLSGGVSFWAGGAALPSAEAQQANSPATGASSLGRPQRLNADAQLIQPIRAEEEAGAQAEALHILDDSESVSFWAGSTGQRAVQPVVVQEERHQPSTSIPRLEDETAAQAEALRVLNLTSARLALRGGGAVRFPPAEQSVPASLSPSARGADLALTKVLQMHTATEPELDSETERQVEALRFLDATQTQLEEQREESKQLKPASFESDGDWGHLRKHTVRHINASNATVAEPDSNEQASLNQIQMLDDSLVDNDALEALRLISGDSMGEVPTRTGAEPLHPSKPKAVRSQSGDAVNLLIQPLKAEEEAAAQAEALRMLDRSESVSFWAGSTGQ